jgi:hypothetical protein
VDSTFLDFFNGNLWKIGQQIFIQFIVKYLVLMNRKMKSILNEWETLLFPIKEGFLINAYFSQYST